VNGEGSKAILKNLSSKFCRLGNSAALCHSLKAYMGNPGLKIPRDE